MTRLKFCTRKINILIIRRELLGNYNEVEILKKRLLKSVARKYILLFVRELKFCNCLIVILCIF